MTEKLENSNKNRFEDMSALVPTNFLSDSTKHNLQLETDEAAVISLLANQLSQQQTQLTGPVLHDEGKTSFMRPFHKHNWISDLISFLIYNVQCGFQQ